MSNWRVYQREWIVSYTSDLAGKEGQDEALRVYEERWMGRITPGDSKMEVTGGHTRILLFLPNLKGEFRERSDALALCQPGGRADPSYATAVIVEPGSPEERALLDYGKRMLPREPAR